MITFSKFLATIKTDVPIKLDMDALVREQADEEALRKIFEELEFRTLIDRIFKKTISLSPLLPDLFCTNKHSDSRRFIRRIYGQRDS